MAQRRKKRKVCFVITSFIHYSRNLLVLEELKKRADVELSIVIGGTALLSKYSARYGQIRELLQQDGFTDVYEVYFNVEGDTPTTKAKTAGLGIIEFANMFNTLRPDVVVVRGDRFEVLSAATAAAYMNIPVAHIEGGDTSGTLDESVRHAITKLAHLHFPTNPKAKKRLISMGEDPAAIFEYGSPDVEMVKWALRNKGASTDLSTTGSGAPIDISKGYIVVMYHPVWSESADTARTAQYARTLLQEIYSLGVQAIWFWPNFDVGAEEIAHEIRHFNDTVKDHSVRFLRYLPPREFLTLLNGAQCLVGNSSAGIKESSYLGLPVVNVGSRQNGRTRARNVIDTPCTQEELRHALVRQIKKGRYSPSQLYSKTGTARNIARVIASHPFAIQKHFND
ncbi:UDP-N-acetylglucosamine 2-epimerase (hydrolyzing) [Candidatus Kaiserbacteria bacterium CG10_big_fil_rev_8_21_14_0_10_49_17]|uniref:UDP-N-acetylglucosamine 2-epimerase (Hydrolyzing) n=1 Tax=Candidatus Kaiserbacteria bacterium CG10_big_fil_rev_8_21_14_0_10_49_17 TaxID=1974609 RepID=A0A2M6WE05_9BACT|nr:MAG: UDP-N-acetylglucosamine 2-epimerase (hydrolyzing) [Candidatus Kaiserbacteria bacterium CG10_big_fil_rev_8_21_14_0_10_49_17]